MPPSLWKGLLLLVLPLVVVGCTSGGGLSDVERREIDTVLERFLEGARTGDDSLMADALAAQVALGVSGGDLGSISREAIVDQLEQAFNERVAGESLSVAASSGPVLPLDIVGRRTRGRGTESRVEGTLLVQETALPVEIGLTKTARGWKIDRFRLLLTPQGTLTGEWSGDWWTIPRRYGEGDLAVTLHQDGGGNLSGQMWITANNCLDNAPITQGYTGSSPTRWATWTAVVERGNVYFFTMDVQDTRMTGTLSFDFFDDCPSSGRFELQR